jgi:uncharacterized Zn-finger protein
MESSKSDLSEYTSASEISNSSRSRIDLTSDKPYTCNFCEKSYTHKEDLDIHKLRHTDSFACKICQKSFSKNQQLNQHNKTKQHIKQVLLHFDVRPCICGICKKKFKTRHDLTRHYLSHNNKYSSKLKKVETHDSPATPSAPEQHLDKEESKKSETYTDSSNSVDFSDFVSVQLGGGEGEETDHQEVTFMNE